jgi:hypothetical protein
VEAEKILADAVDLDAAIRVRSLVVFGRGGGAGRGG